MTEKRFTDFTCNETGTVWIDDYGKERKFYAHEFEAFLNELAEENIQLRLDIEELKPFKKNHLRLTQ